MKLSDKQKAELREMIESPLLSLAMTEALRAVHSNQGEKSSLEEAAMAYSYQAGATKVLGNLFSMAESKKQSTAVAPRKLRY
jgi:hypothetical protein|tara:strand:+ start:4531 stop:4776 length:246 start_codon:yes stop_codon:yes gene_type:complete